MADGRDRETISREGSKAPDRLAEEAKAVALVAQVEQLGGKALRADARPGSPVTQIDLTNSRVTDENLVVVARNTRLKLLLLDSTPITNAGLSNLKGITELLGLSLKDTKITDAGLVHLKELKSLQILSLSNTMVTVAGIESLKGMPRLKTLIVSETLATPENLRIMRLALPGVLITDRDK